MCAPAPQVQKEMEFFDIFVRFDGKLRWVECVEGLAVARQHAICFSERFLGESLIYSERDGTIIRRINRAPRSIHIFPIFRTHRRISVTGIEGSVDDIQPRAT